MLVVFKKKQQKQHFVSNYIYFCFPDSISNHRIFAQYIGLFIKLSEIITGCQNFKQCELQFCEIIIYCLNFKN